MKQVCIIDDDADVRDVMGFALSTEGHEVVYYENAKAALNAFKTLPENEGPAMIVVDYLMPQMDGITFINEIRQRWPNTLGNIPILLCTASGYGEKRPTPPPGVTVLSKPMELDEFLSIVRQNVPLS